MCACLVACPPGVIVVVIVVIVDLGVVVMIVLVGGIIVVPFGLGVFVVFGVVVLARVLVLVTLKRL